MLNIEKYQKEIRKEIEKRGRGLNCAIHIITSGGDICYMHDDCAKCGTNCLTWALEEYIEPIKLTKFEYDLLKTNDQSHARSIGSYKTYLNMKKVGYYNNIKNWDLTIGEILENSEVIKDET